MGNLDTVNRGYIKDTTHSSEVRAKYLTCNSLEKNTKTCAAQPKTVLTWNCQRLVSLGGKKKNSLPTLFYCCWVRKAQMLKAQFLLVQIDHAHTLQCLLKING